MSRETPCPCPAPQTTVRRRSHPHQQVGRSSTFIALGVGVQKYSCANTCKYTYVVPCSASCFPATDLCDSRSTGAVAELFDISCLPESSYTDLTNDANTAWQAAPSGFTPQQVISTLAPLRSPFVLGQHYYIVNPLTGSGISPKWDFTSASFPSNPNAFVVGDKKGDVHAPEDPSVNIDWVSLDKLGSEGELADKIFRVMTRGGQPPASVSVCWCVQAAEDADVYV